MKKILFVVENKPNNQLGFRLCMEYPYGRTDRVEWHIIFSEWLEQDTINKKMHTYNTIYEIQTDKTISSDHQEDLIIIKNANTDTLTACIHANTPYIIWNESKTHEDHYSGQLLSNNIVLRYQQTTDAQYDYLRISSDFLNIIHQKPSKNTPKHLYKTEKQITYAERSSYRFNFTTFQKLTMHDKKLLNLKLYDEYMTTLTKSNEEYYCCVNKKIRDVIHFDAWLQLH